jgi:hypothetical protein
MSAIRRFKLVPTDGKDLRQLIVLRVALVSYALEQSTPDLHDQKKRSSSDALWARGIARRDGAGHAAEVHASDAVCTIPLRETVRSANI